jgi:hypothetical protein
MAGEQAELNEDYLKDTPEFEPEQAGTEIEFEQEPEPVDLDPDDPVEPEPEPTGTEPEPEATGTGPDEKEKDVEPEPNEVLKEQIETMRKGFDKLEKRTMYLQRQLEKANEAKDAEDKDAQFEKELSEKYPEPQIDDFDEYSDYEEARIDWKIDVGIERGLRKDEPAADGKAGPAADVDFANKTIADGKSKYSDFADVALVETVPITNEIIDATKALDSDNVKPEDVFYYLGKNPAEAAKISRMNRDQVTKAIAKIEGKLEAAVKKAGKKPNSKIKDVPDAPEPIKPTDSTVIITKDPEKMSQAEYEKWRMEQGVS